jgi:hypothetical protein
VTVTFRYFRRILSKRNHIQRCPRRTSGDFITMANLDVQSLVLGIYTTSSAEGIARLFLDANVVKAFLMPYSPRSTPARIPKSTGKRSVFFCRRRFGSKTKGRRTDRALWALIPSRSTTKCPLSGASVPAQHSSATRVGFRHANWVRAAPRWQTLASEGQQCLHEKSYS